MTRQEELRENKSTLSILSFWSQVKSSERVLWWVTRPTYAFSLLSLSVNCSRILDSRHKNLPDIASRRNTSDTLRRMLLVFFTLLLLDTITGRLIFLLQSYPTLSVSKFSFTNPCLFIVYVALFTQINEPFATRSGGLFYQIQPTGHTPISKLPTNYPNSYLFSVPNWAKINKGKVGSVFL